MIEVLEKLKLYGPRKFFLFCYLELKRSILQEWIKKSYSQHGEDIIIDKLLGEKKKGFYIDVGAHHPHRLSNTKRFYDRGWQGINIEPEYLSYKTFVSERPKDINLNVAVSKENGNIQFYKFFPPALSTCSSNTRDQYIAAGFSCSESVEIPTHPLRQIVEDYANDREIDFLSIDTEGFEMDVLWSNDWEKFRPRVVCIEVSSCGADKHHVNKISKEMVQNNQRGI